MEWDEEERPSDRLSPRLRNILILRIAGYNYTDIGECLGISRATVYTYIKRINRLFLRGITKQDDTREVGYRVAYVYGLLDAGCDVPEIAEKLQNLEARVRRAQIGTPRVRTDLSSCHTEFQKVPDS
jgi:hypothetical protein